jgi:inorganic pyrophosphatase
MNAEAGNVAGDNDPLDVVEIGAAAHPTGSVVPARAQNTALKR